MTRRRTWWAAVLALGCGSPAPKKPIAKPAAAAAPAAPAAPTDAPPEAVYIYSPIGKRDPFRSPLDDLIISKQSEAQCPLCKWEIDQLHLVAVVTGTGNPVAMVEDPDGVGHELHQGTQVGKRGGKVTTIRREQVVITETSHDPFGKSVSTKSLLKLPNTATASDLSQAPSLLDE